MSSMQKEHQPPDPSENGTLSRLQEETEEEVNHKHDKDHMAFREHEKSHAHTPHGGKPEGHKHPVKHHGKQEKHHHTKEHDHKKHTREHHKPGKD